MRILEEFASQVLAYSGMARREIDRKNRIFLILGKNIRQDCEVIEYSTIRRARRSAISDAAAR